MMRPFRLPASRVAASRSSLARGVRAPLAQSLLSVRCFSSEKKEVKEVDTYIGDAPYVPAPEERSGILDKFGIVPIVGFAAAIALSKEILLLNEELVLVFTFGTFVTTSYLALSDTVNASAKEHYETTLAEYRKLYDDHIAAAHRVRATHQRFVDSVQESRDMLEHYVALRKQMQETTELRLRHSLREEFMDRLQKLATHEATTFKKARTAVLERATQHARNQFLKASAENKAKHFVNVLTALKMQDKKAVVMPVTRAFRAYFDAFKKARATSKDRVYQVSDETTKAFEAELAQQNVPASGKLPTQYKPVF